MMLMAQLPRCFRVAALCGCFVLTWATARAVDSLDDLLKRTSARTADSIEKFSEVKCTERVRQQKLSDDGKVERDIESSYDYLVIFTDAGGELSLDESRLPLQEGKADKKHVPLLVTNGFATLFLVFHPYYTASFQFTALEDEVVAGRSLKKVGFSYVRGTRSPAALSLRGREYPLQLSGTAWIEPQSGAITKIAADIGNSMEDVGLKMMHSEVEYAAVPSQGPKAVDWFPARASVELRTMRQHWLNTHMFTRYQRFSVSTDEKVASQ